MIGKTRLHGLALQQIEASSERRSAQLPGPRKRSEAQPSVVLGPVTFADRPSNQPVNRFRGFADIPSRPADPLPSWMATPFKKHGVIMEPNADHDWESKHVFNPTAIVKDGKVFMLYRAEDHSGVGKWNGTSRIGLAVSEDGIHFERRPTPILEPTEPYEIPGGCEDPRVVQLGDKYVMTYTAYDGKTARLAIAVSDDLVNWEKKGLVFPDIAKAPIVKDNPEWSKSGAIVPEKINGKYHMYFGEGEIFHATSDDGLKWTHDPESVVKKRPGYFDMLLAEPGPTCWVDKEGIHLLYNGDAPPDGYAVGEVVFDKNDPKKIVRRSNTPFLKPTEDYEITGQVGNVLFAEGLVFHRGKAFLYYGAADGKIAAASADLANAKPARSVLADQIALSKQSEARGWR
jgi:beta-1,2-mannosidase